MTQIRTLFDPAKDIYRTIEKVITYNASQEARLKAEVMEYIVTDSIEDQLERLLSRMDVAMEVGGQHEVGVWVSGFYGSGKSSFTKYLGLALDETVQVDGIPFLKHLQDRLNRPTTKALLGSVARKYPTAVVLLDLASEMLAGATMEDVSTVLYYKVLQWAGYSQNLKVAALERRLQKDGRYHEFTDRIAQDAGVPWSEVRNDPLVIDSLIPEIAHDLYPTLFKTPTAFNTETADIVRFENERVQEMINIVRETTGKKHMIFIIDEVGQYVGARPNLILNLDGLSKNLKQLGNGQVWIMGTAQQTLTEDDPRAAFNSPELYKLKDRFPILIDLESKDIKEICYRRLLGKSPTGEQMLGKLFDQHGQALRHNTRLQDARYYDADFDRQTFINLYPFLPAHFEILLHLLGALAKSTGGIGLRSAIKVIQDILIEGTNHHDPVANQSVGWLATTVTLYDALEKDIGRAYPTIHKAVGKALVRFTHSALHQEVAKTVAVLQILGNMPITVQNVTSLMQPTVTASSRREQVETAVQEMTNDGLVPFGEKDGGLCFFSEKLNDIDQERALLPLRTIETRRIQNEALRNLFTPLPSTRLHGSLAVTAGLKTTAGNLVSSIVGERETIQMQAEFVPPADYDQTRTRLVDESRQHTARYTICLLGRTDPQIDALLGEIYRARTIAERRRTDPDQEVREYCTGQLDRATTLEGEVQRLLKNSLRQGSFVFRGQITAVDGLDQDVREAARKLLSTVAQQVFERYDEAPERADTALAEKFLRIDNLRAITKALDPLELVQMSGGIPSIKSEHKALLSIRDYLDRNGSMEGKTLTNHFTDAPFGWSPDTLRYLVAGLLVAGEIKLKKDGRDITVKGQQAIEALRTNNSFKDVGVALRDTRPSNEVLARAAQRLTELTGDSVIPLEDEISKTATRHFPRFQHRFGPLAEKLRHHHLPGADAVAALNDELADVLLTDASDAPQRLGGETSTLYENLRWANRVDVAFEKGLEKTVEKLRQSVKGIQELPDTGIPGQLRADLAEELELLAQRLGQDTFYEYAADLNSLSTTLQARIRDAAAQLAAAQQARLKEMQQTLQQLPDWAELTQAEQYATLGQLEMLLITPTQDLAGLKELLNQEYNLQSQVSAIRGQVQQLAHQRRADRLQAEKEKALREGREKISRSIRIPARMDNPAQLDRLIQALQTLKTELGLYSDIEVTIEIDEAA
ncbi:MAG: BREX system P-loop protein BrxC [Anaerolineae bacterium]|nr:BREX system P-loop protein BrxC [Anaerolineae bacterium]